MKNSSIFGLGYFFCNTHLAHRFLQFCNLIEVAIYHLNIATLNFIFISLLMISLK